MITAAILGAIGVLTPNIIIPPLSKVESFDLASLTQADLDIDPTLYDRIQVFFHGDTTGDVDGDASKDGGISLLSASGGSYRSPEVNVSEGVNQPNKFEAIHTASGTGVKAFLEFSGHQAGMRFHCRSYAWLDDTPIGSTFSNYWQTDTDSINMIRVFETTNLGSVGTVWIAYIKDQVTDVLDLIDFSVDSSPTDVDVRSYDYLKTVVHNADQGASSRRYGFKFDGLSNIYTDGNMDGVTDGIAGSIGSTREAWNFAGNTGFSKNFVVETWGLRSGVQGGVYHGRSDRSETGFLVAADANGVQTLTHGSYFSSGTNFATGEVTMIGGKYHGLTDLTPVRTATDTTHVFDVTGKEEFRMTFDSVGLSASTFVELRPRRVGQGSYESNAADFDMVKTNMFDYVDHAYAGGLAVNGDNEFVGVLQAYGLREGLPFVVISHIADASRSNMCVVMSWYDSTEAIDSLELRPQSGTMNDAGTLRVEANEWILDAPTPEQAALNLFNEFDDGDLWVFDPDHTNASNDADPITTATGLKNSYVMTNVGDPTLKDMGNGKWAADFDGTDGLVHTFASALQAGGTIVLALWDTDTSTHVICTGGSATTRWQISNDSGGDLIAFAGAEMDSWTNEGWLDDPDGHIIGVRFDGTNGLFRIDGATVRQGSADNVGSQTLDEIRLGILYDNTFGMTGQIAGVLVIDRPLTLTEFRIAETWARSLTKQPARPSAISDKVIRMVLPDSFTFTSGNLSDIDPVFGPGNQMTIVGNLTEGSEGGYLMEEAYGPGRYLSLLLPELINVSGTLTEENTLILLYRKKDAADTEIILVGSSGASDYAGVGDSGEASTVTAQNVGLEEFMLPNGTTYGAGTTRGELYDAVYADEEIRAVALHHFEYGSTMRLFTYSSGDAFIGEVEVLGFATIEADASPEEIQETMNYMIQAVTPPATFTMLAAWTVSHGTKSYATGIQRMEFDSLLYDHNDLLGLQATLDTPADVTGVTAPAGTTFAIVHVSGQRNGTGSAYYEYIIFKNGVYHTGTANHGGDYNTGTAGVVIDCAPGDVIEAYCNRNTGSGLDHAMFSGRFYGA